MGKRGNLYQSARDCINALKTGSPLSQHVVYDDLGMSIIFVTRRHLRETATTILDILEHNDVTKDDFRHRMKPFSQKGLARRACPYYVKLVNSERVFII